MLSSREITTQGMTDAQIEFISRTYYGGDARLARIGPLLFGLWTDAVLMGVLIYLFVNWHFKVARTDNRWTRWLIYYQMIVSIAATVHSYGFLSHALVEGFGAYRYLIASEWVRLTFVFVALSRGPCSAFFTHRAWMMYDRHQAIPCLIVPLIVAYTVCWFCVTGYYEWIPIPIVARRFVWAAAGIELVVDIALTTLLALALIRSRTGWAETDKLIRRILITLMETQAPPTFCAIGFVIVSSRWADTSLLSYWQAAPKIYPICLLLVVTSRIDLAKSISTGMSYHSGMQSKVEAQSSHLPRVSVHPAMSTTSPDDSNQVGLYSSAADSTSGTDLLARRDPAVKQYR